VHKKKKKPYIGNKKDLHKKIRQNSRITT